MWVNALLFFVVGAVVGSFLNVVITGFREMRALLSHPATAQVQSQISPMGSHSHIVLPVFGRQVQVLR